MYTVTSTGPEPARSPLTARPFGTAGAPPAAVPVAGAAWRPSAVPPDAAGVVGREPPPLGAAGVVGREPPPLGAAGVVGREPPPLGAAGVVVGGLVIGGATGVAGADGGVMMGFVPGRLAPELALLPFPPPALVALLIGTGPGRSTAGLDAWACPGAPRATPVETAMAAPDAAAARMMRRE